jgi:DNA polymerase-3 subunit epsilon
MRVTLDPNMERGTIRVYDAGLRPQTWEGTDGGKSMSWREVIVVDVETSGLRRDVDIAVEIAWCNMTTGQAGSFVPVHDVAWVLANGDPEALRLNHYRERLAGAEQDVHGVGWHNMREQLTGNSWAGSNPAFDTHYWHKAYGPDVYWHHRLVDLAAYAGGVMGLPLAELEGLEAVCEKVNVVNRAPHTALGDVYATARCFHAIQAIRATFPASGLASQ